MGIIKFVKFTDAKIMIMIFDKKIKIIFFKFESDFFKFFPFKKIWIIFEVQFM